MREQFWDALPLLTSNLYREAQSRVPDQQSIDFTLGEAAFSQRRDEGSKQSIIRAELPSAKFSDPIPARVLRHEYLVQQALVSKSDYSVDILLDRVAAADVVKGNPCPTTCGADLVR